MNVCWREKVGGFTYIDLRKSGVGVHILGPRRWDVYLVGKEARRGERAVLSKI